jgi:O-antigen/teichoic acid export membrane protein
MSKSNASWIKNTSIVTGASIVEYAFGLIAGILVARSLGPSEFGLYSYTLWLVAFFSGIALGPFTNALLKYLPEARFSKSTLDEFDIAKLFWRLQSWLMLASASLMACFAYLAPELSTTGSSTSILVISILSLFFRSRFRLIVATAQGLERFDIEAISLILSAVVNLAVILIVFALKLSLIEFLYAYLLTGLVQWICASILIRQRLPVRNIPSRSKIDYRYFRPFLVSTTIVTLISILGNRTLEFLLLKYFSTTVEIGYFSVAVTFFGATAQLMTTGIGATLTPAFARKVAQFGDAGAGAVFNDYLHLFFIFGLAAAGVGALAIPSLVTLMYGAAYAPAETGLFIAQLLCAVFIFNLPFSSYMLSSKYAGDRVKVSVLNIIVNTVLALYLIPKFGSVGAIASFSLTFLFGAIASAAYVKHRLQFTLFQPASIRIAFVFLMTFLACYYLRAISTSNFLILLSSLLFALSYFYFLLRSKVFKQAEIAGFLDFSRRLAFLPPTLRDWFSRILLSQVRYLE